MPNLRMTEEQVAAYYAKQGKPVNAQPAKKPKPSKYKNQKSGGYDSKKEAARAAELSHMQRAGLITGLVEQPVYLLIPKQEGERAVKYKADFRYTDCSTGQTVVEDVKSEATKKLKDYILKRKLMLSVHGIKVIEV